MLQEKLTELLGELVRNNKMKENAFRSKRSNIEKIPILRAEVERLESYKCLGVHLDNRLDWILKKWTVNRTCVVSQCVQQNVA